MSDVKHRVSSVDIPNVPRMHAVDIELEGHRPRAATAHPVSDEHQWARKYRTKLRFTDTAIVTGSVMIAFVFRFGIEDAGTRVNGFSAEYGALTGVIIVAWLVALAFGRSRDTRVAGVGVTEYRRVVTSSALTFGVLAVLFLIFKVEIARGFFVLALPVGIIGLAGSRWLWRHWLNTQRERGHYLTRALVAGAAEDVQYVVDQIHEKSGAVYNIVGCATGSTEDERLACEAQDVLVVADLSTIAIAASNLRVDTVIVAGHPSDDSNFIRDLSWQLEGTAAELVLASRLTDVAGPRIHFRPVEGLPLIHVEIPQFEGGKHLAKRALDIIASGFGLIALFPFFVIIGLLVRMDSPGGALFRQERVGRNGATFQMVKFRTMKQNAEFDLAKLAEQNEGSGALFKLKNDPRVTRVGRILRKYSLDEFPQLWNIFIGDMSLVGPRPPLPSEVRSYEGRVHRRLYIKPGLTGMWQINGRSDLSWDESVRLDLYYVENWSLTGDLMILWRTAKVLVNPVGAY